MHAYAFMVSVRRLLSVMVALAVLFSPAFGRAGQALASAPDRHMQIKDGGHCQSPQPHSGHHEDHDNTAGQGSCLSLCIGTAVTPAAETCTRAPAPAAPDVAVTALHLSYLGEIATPPPKPGPVQNN